MQSQAHNPVPANYRIYRESLATANSGLKSAHGSWLISGAASSPLLAISTRCPSSGEGSSFIPMNKPGCEVARRASQDAVERRS
jgi:hypothetical protein